MKKIFLGFAAMSLLALSCAKQEGMVSETKPEANYKLTAEMESAQTRTTPELAEGTTYNLHWAKGDKISVFVGKTMENREFTLSDGEGTKTATFEGNLNEGESISFAAYPYNAGHSISANYVMPSVYGDVNTEYVPNTNAHLMAQMVAVGGSEEGAAPKLSFSHLGGVLALELYCIPAKVKGVVLTANKGITGEVSFADELMENCELSAKESDGTNNSITIYFKPEDKVRNETFYFPLPVGTYQFKVELIGGDDQKILVIDSKADNEIKRAGLKIMPKLPVAPAPGKGGYYEVTEEQSDWTGKYLVVYAENGIEAGQEGRIFKARTCGFDNTTNKGQFNSKNDAYITFNASGYIDSDHCYAGEYIEVTKAEDDNMYYVTATAYEKDESDKYTVPSIRYLYQKGLKNDGTLEGVGLHNSIDPVACKLEWSESEGLKIWGRINSEKDAFLMYSDGSVKGIKFSFGSVAGSSGMNLVKFLKYREE